MTRTPQYFALVPAAGSGSRARAGSPKQYLPIAGRPLLYYTLRRLAAHKLVRDVYVVLAPDDTQFRTFDWADLPKVQPLYCGGETRAASVANGLNAVEETVGPDDWILVHDAARPCLSAAALDRLIREIGSDAAGGVLAIPVTDTLKRADGEGRVVATERRDQLWRAQTPQMFRFKVLAEALRVCGAAVTDDSSAVERLGLTPKLVIGERRNIKVTYPEDLEVAALILATESETTSNVHA